jgi:hypothetical protein
MFSMHVSNVNLGLGCVICFQSNFRFRCACSETTLTGESWFHISTPLGIEPGSLMTGSKGLTQWTNETVYKCSEISGSPQGSPPAADYVGCEA